MEPTRRPQPAGTCIAALTYDRRTASRLGATKTMGPRVFQASPAPTLSVYQFLLPPLRSKSDNIFCFFVFLFFFFGFSWVGVGEGGEGRD